MKLQNQLRSAAAPLAMLVAGAAIPIALPTVAHAQDYTNVTATGRVVGTDGTPISGATVTVTSNDQGGVRTVQTDSSGSYRVPQIAPGSYTFSISADGFEGFTDENVYLSAAGAANQFALVSASGGSGEIVVRAGREEIVDFDRTTTGLVISVAELAKEVPVARDLTSIVALSPGVARGDTAFGNLPSVSGASVSENQYFVNGLNVTDFRKGLGSATVPFDFYETVEVKNGGYQAEFGRSTGGFVNAVTKSGSNDFSGSVTFNYEPDSLRSDAPDSRNPLTNNSLFVDNSRDYAERIDTIVQLSGPIWKDHLFFYGIYNHRNVKNGGGVATANRYDEAKTDDPFYGAKFDFIPFDGHKFEATYFNSEGETLTSSYNYNPETDVLGAFTSSERTQYGSENYVGRYTGVFTDWFSFSAAYGKSKLRENTLPNDVVRPLVIDNRSGTPISIANPSNIIERAEDEREFYRFDADFYVDLFGSHHFRIGYDNEKLNSNNTSSYTGNVAYQLFNSGPTGDTFVTTPNTDYVAGRTFINGGIFETENEAFYIQDNWSLFNNRLQLQMGIRNDRFVNRNADGDVFYSSGDQWGPRLGFTFDVFDNSRAKLYGSFGRYFLPIPSNTNVRLAGAEFDLTRYNLLTGVNADGTPVVGAPVLFTGADACFDTGVRNCENISDGSANPTDALVAKNLKPQSVDEYILGGEVRVGDRWKFGLYGTYRSLNESLEDAAIDAAVAAYCDRENLDCTTPSGSDIWTGFHQYVLINPGSASVITLSNLVNGETTPRTVEFSAADLGYPKAKRVYKALTFTFDREFDGVWSMSGSYTLSSTKGNIEGGVKSDNGQDDSGITTDFDQPGFSVGSDGFLPNHRAHNFKLFGSYKVAEWLTLGTNIQVTSPRKFGCIGRVPRLVDPFAGAYGAAGFFCNLDSNGDVITNPATPGFTFANPFPGPGATTTLQSTPRGSQFQSDWLKEVNLSAVFKLPVDFDASVRFDVFNVFNSKAQLDFEERGTLNNGTPRNSYRLPTGFQAPRSARIQLNVGF